MLRIRLLGPPRLEFGAENIPLSARPKVLPLLGFLLLHSSAPVQRERIASSLWSDDTDSAARANLRRHLHYLRALLPPVNGKSWVLSTARSVQWNTRSNYVLDVDEFTRCAADPTTLTQAVEIYAGELMEGTDEE